MQIVYATDGSAGAVAAADLLARLVLTEKDRIVLLAVPAGGADRAEEWFAGARRALGACPAAVETQTRQGSPAEQILDFARESAADLITVGAVGHTNLSRFLVGSVAERVVRHAHKSVLVGRSVKHGLARALVAVDGTAASDQVADYASAFPLPRETELELTTVLPSREALAGAAPLVLGGLGAELEKTLAEAQVETRERLAELAKRLQSVGRRVSGEIVNGEPAAALVAAAEREHADLIISGCRDAGTVDRLLMSSVSERLARHAGCSVLIHKDTT